MVEVSEPKPVNEVRIRRPEMADGREFIWLMRHSRRFHYPFVAAPTSLAEFQRYIQSRCAASEDGFIILADGHIAGLINLNRIIRGSLLSANLGYYLGVPFAARRVMSRALRLVIMRAFEELGLHRLEANIQPENHASLCLVQRLGFRKEGFSPKYMRLYGEWRDHERWALLNDYL